MDMKALDGLTWLKAPKVHSASEFHDWVRAAPVGAWAEYWRGFLAFDRQCFVPHSIEVGSAAMARSDDRHVVLLQRRLGFADYSYLAKRI
jgi:hypothetical protein